MTIIIVDYNSIEATIEYIDRCRQSLCTKEKLSFVIVENGNVENSAKIEALLGEKSTAHMTKTGLVLKYFYGDVEVYYFFANNNLGFAKGNNRGIAITEELIGDEYYIVSNNDITFPKEIDLDSLVQIMKKNKKMAVLGPRVVGIEAGDQSPRKKLSTYELLFEQYWLAMVYRFLKKSVTDICYDGKSKYSYWVSGCFTLMKGTAIKDIGYFDEGTFLFCEEMILAERLKKKGYRMYFYNEVQIIHAESETIKRDNSFINQLEMTHDSLLYYSRKYGGINIMTLCLSKLNFSIYKLLYKLKVRFIEND